MFVSRAVVAGVVDVASTSMAAAVMNRVASTTVGPWARGSERAARVESASSVGEGGDWGAGEWMCVENMGDASCARVFGVHALWT